MRWRLEYNNSQSYLRDVAPNAQIMQDVDGKTRSTGKTYTKDTIPGTVKIYTPRMDQSGKMIIHLSQEKLNEIVRDMGIYENGVQITSAPLGTGNHVFWKSPDVNFLIESGKLEFDDEEPRYKLFMAALRADSQVHITEAGKKRTSITAHHRWKLTPVGASGHDEVVAETAPSMRALEVFSASTHEDRINALKYLGVTVHEKTDPDVVKSLLFQHITDKKDMNAGGGTYLEKYLSYSERPKEYKYLYAIVADGKKLFTKKNKQYLYGEIKLGSTDDEIVQRLKEDPDLAAEIQSATQAINKKRGNESFNKKTT